MYIRIIGGYTTAIQYLSALQSSFYKFSGNILLGIPISDVNFVKSHFYVAEAIEKTHILQAQSV